MGDPGFKAAAAVDSDQASVTDIQVDIPSEVSAGDRLLMVLSVGPNTVSEDPPGWTRIFDTSAPPGTITASGGRMLGWTAVAGSQPDVDPGETVTIELGGSSRASLGLYAAGPCDILETVVGPVSTMPSSGPFTRSTPMAQVDDKTRVVHIYGINGNDGTNDSVLWAFDAATTERVNAASAAPNFRNMTVGIADEEEAGPGTVGGRTATASHRTQACAVTIVLNTEVDRPVATASTPTPTVAAGMPGVQLNGSADNGAGPPFTYSWQQLEGPAVVLSDATTQNPTFTAPNEPGELVFGLTVTDTDNVSSLQDTVTITVVAAADTAIPIVDVHVDGWQANPPGAPTIASLLGDADDDTFALYPNPSNALLEVRLSELVPPMAGEPINVIFRVSFRSGTKGAVTLQLREGSSTVLASADYQWTAAQTVNELTLPITTEVAALINDWDDLRLRLVGTVT